MCSGLAPSKASAKCVLTWLPQVCICACAISCAQHACTHARTHARTHTHTHTHTHTGSCRTERRGCRCCRKSSPSAAPANHLALHSQLALLAFRTSRNTCRFSVRALGPGFSLAACFYTCVLDVKSWNALGRAQCRWWTREVPAWFKLQVYYLNNIYTLYLPAWFKPQVYYQYT